MTLFEAFFSRTEDISNSEVLGRLASLSGLSADALSQVIGEERSRDRVLAEHRGALASGIHAVPAVILPGRPPIMGAVPYAVLRREVDAALRQAQTVP